MTSLNELWELAVADTEGKDGLVARQKFMELAQYTEHSIRDKFNFMLSLSKDCPK